jgi:hypothetical protein
MVRSPDHQAQPVNPETRRNDENEEENFPAKIEFFGAKNLKEKLKKFCQNCLKFFMTFLNQDPTEQGPML